MAKTINRNEESFVIIMSPVGFKKGYDGLVIFGGIFTIFGIVLLLLLSGAYYVNNFLSKIYLALFSIPWLCGDLAMLWLICSVLFSEPKLEINQIQIFENAKMFGLEIGERQCNKRQDIFKIERIKRQIKLTSLPDYSPEDLSTIYEDEIIILAGESKYRLSKSSLPDTDLDWLANELSEWLKLPIISVEDA